MDKSYPQAKINSALSLSSVFRSISGLCRIMRAFLNTIKLLKQRIRVMFIN